MLPVLQYTLTAYSEIIYLCLALESDLLTLVESTDTAGP